MSSDNQNVNTAQIKELENLSEELHMLEVETFEIEDFLDLGQNPAALSGTSCSACSGTSCSATSCA